MFGRCEKLAGGPGSKKAKLHNSSETSDNPDPSYKARLRPRPTRQTDYFRPSIEQRRPTSSNTVKRTISTPVVSGGAAVVRPTRASILREKAAAKKKNTADCHPEGPGSGKGINTDHSIDSPISPKRTRSESFVSAAKNQGSKKGTSGKHNNNNNNPPKVKEVAAKLWFPFIPPVTSSDSEEEENLNQVSGSAPAASEPPKKLASRSSKTNTEKPTTKEKTQTEPSTSTGQKSQKSEKPKTKPSTSKSSSRFHLSSFSKSDTSNKSGRTSAQNSATESTSSAPASSTNTSAKSARPKSSRSLKGKSSSKPQEEEGKGKTRKRYQSPPSHLLHNRKTTTSKTGSCASTSRRGRGKSSSNHSRDSEQGAASVMSQDRARSSQEAASNQATNNTDNNPATGESQPSSGANANAEAEFDDPDMSRLQALLEARGLPSHFFGTLGPRVQQILHRSVNSGTNSKAQQLLQGMQTVGDESRQLQSVIEMCQLLVMGNEDTLAGFPIKSVVPALITLLKMEHNFDIMNHACRALTYMMEALPRSSAIVVDAVPVFLEKLQSIQCMDVAEQSLTALEMLSRRHGASILRADGLSSCLLYLDFFSLPAQRNALTVAANCCSVLSVNDQHSEFDKYYGSSVTLLGQRLTHHDKKCVESVCLCFARLVDNYHSEATILRKIANDGLLENFQSLLVVTPPLIGSSTFVMVIRTMCMLCSSCPDLATQLVRHNIAETLRYLLCGTATDSEQIELVPRSPQELYEITSLIGELMPRLPKDDPMFSVDRILKQGGKQTNNDGAPMWQWKQYDGSWTSYSKHDNGLIEDAHRSGDQEASLMIQGRVYLLDFPTMQQVNEESGNSRAIRRQPERKSRNKQLVKTESDQSMTDARVSLVKEDRGVISMFVRSLFSLLYEVYGSSAGSPAVRHKCLRAVQRMVYYAEPDLLGDVLKNLSVSSHIASMLSSYDLKVLVGALQMAMILMNKLPDIFKVYFLREGVTHQVEQLLDPNHKVVGINHGESPQAGTSSNPTSPSGVSVFEGAPSSTDPSPSEPIPGRLSDMLRRKYTPRRSSGKRMSSSSSAANTPDESSSKSNRNKPTASSPTDRVISPPLTKAKAFAAAMSTYDGSVATPTGTKSSKSNQGSSNRSSASSFFFNFNPTRWGRSSSTSTSGGASQGGNVQTPPPMTHAASQPNFSNRLSREKLNLPNLKKMTVAKENHKEKVKQWVREQAKIFLESYFTASQSLNPHNDDSSSTEQPSLLAKLSAIAQSLSICTETNVASTNLTELCDIINTSDVSSFELQHSGIVTSVLQFLTREAPDDVTMDQGSSPKNAPKRKSSTATPPPPMVTRRRSKTDTPAVAQSLDVAKLSDVAKFERPKTAPGEHMTPSVGERQIRGDAFEMETVDDVVDADKTIVDEVKGVTLSREDRLRCFLNTFAGLPTNRFSGDEITLHDVSNVSPLRTFVQKLNLCVNQLEQFSVRSHDLPSAPGRGSQALTFFAKHQLKCQLQRHPDCSKSKQWHGGPVRVDPLALVQAIERYLIARGYGNTPTDSDQSERRDVLMLMGDEDSEDEIEVDEDDGENDDLESNSPLSSEHTSSATSSAVSTSSSKHRLELYVGSHRLPYNMTVYQAVKHFGEERARSPSLMMSSDERDTDDEIGSIASTGVWNTTHVIHYKMVSGSDSQSGQSSGSKKNSQKVSPKLSKKNDALWNTGVVPTLKRPLDSFLSQSLPQSFITPDPSKEVLCLMRVVFGLTKYWHNLYAPTSLVTDRQLLPTADFVNNKLVAKCNRQLLDPLMIMTGELPSWLGELAHACPFVLPFETRQLLFRVVSFDRDRAMQYLLDTGAVPELTAAASNSASSSLNHEAGNRFMPKIDKKKCVVKRDHLLPQAEKLMNEHAHTRALLEIQYDDEVGTGLGPTLEFYTLTSHELQRTNLCLWRSDEKSNSVETSNNMQQPSLKKLVKKVVEIVEETMSPVNNEASYVHSPVGLYPLPIGRSSKLGPTAKTCAKFRFMGKLLAKAVLDGRMVDIPLSLLCYKWLLGQEHTITWLDLEQVDPGMSLTFNKLQKVLHQRVALEHENPEDLDQRISSLTMDGCKLEDLGLDFLLPGFPSIELMKGGSKQSLTIQNLDKYLNLIAHWTLMEGVRQQLDAVREGFQSVFPLQTIDYFFPEELVQLFCGARYQPWSERELADSCRTDHGYNHDSEAVKTLFRVLSQYDATEQRSFLQFVTGSPHLPVGGLRSLHPPLTVVRKTCEEGKSADEYLPSVMTCVNYLKLPDYSNETVLRQRLSKATTEGQKSFLLS
uniref:E3 ubiquitin-protein ligase n=1 Tax=Phallusia mammillata TaxID=59560 RepID=A0A6F9DUZ3_9ASCI|nr:E3 ubiquitin-protein ligase TRIP12 [Phallusia mammillata]